MTVLILGGGALKLEKEEDKVFWIRDCKEKSQTFGNQCEAVKALRERGIRWSKTRKTENVA